MKTANGDTVQRRTTYVEIATPSQIPTEPCNVHGEPRARLAREFPASDLPRAALAVDLSEVAPVVIRSPTLLADKDPYNSLKPTLKPEPAPQPATETAGNQNPDSVASETGATRVKAGAIDLNRPPATGVGDPSEPSAQAAQSAPEIRKAVPVEAIRKAIPVQSQDEKPAEIRRAIPVKPLDQEDVDQTLLKSAARPSGNLDE
jgi:hypothetical protein